MRKPAFWLTVAFLFTVPWEDALELGAIGRISRVLGLVAITVWALSVVVRRRIRRPTAFVKAYFVFLIWSGLTLFWSVSPGSSFGGFVTYTQIFGMILMMWDLYETDRKIETGLQAFVLGAYVSSISLVMNWVSAPPTRFPEHQRISALGFETDGIALIVALAMPAAWFLAVSPHGQLTALPLRILNFGYVPLAIFGIILTGTRGAALASIPTAVFILWTLRNIGLTRRLMVGVMLVTALAAVWFAPREPLERIIGSFTDIASGDSLSGRRDIWVSGVEAFFDNPVAGVGLDAFRAASPYGKEAHNTALSILVETGMVGFLLFGYLVVAVVAATRQQAGWAAWYWGTQLAVVALGSMSLSLEDSKPLWIMLTLAVASASVERMPLSSMGQEPVRLFGGGGPRAPEEI